MEPAHDPRPGWSRPAVLALLLAQLWVLTAALARLGVSSAERALFTALHDLPAVLQVPLVVVMPLGSFLGGMAVAVLARLVARDMAYRAALAVPLAWLAATGTKVAVSRGRPADVLQQAIEATAGASGPGYPSGHTAVAVALATALWPDLGGAGRVVVALLATMVALSRVATGVHLPLDLVGGAAIGALAGLGAQAVVTRARRATA